MLQADAYTGFNARYQAGAIQEAARWAHEWRKFYDLHEGLPLALTTEALRKIGEVNRSEAEMRGKPPDER